MALLFLVMQSTMEIAFDQNSFVVWRPFRQSRAFDFKDIEAVQLAWATGQTKMLGRAHNIKIVGLDVECSDGFRFRIGARMHYFHHFVDELLKLNLSIEEECLIWIRMNKNA
jgi:hypothetical protein